MNLKNPNFQNLKLIKMKLMNLKLMNLSLMNLSLIKMSFKVEFDFYEASQNITNLHSVSDIGRLILCCP